MIEFHLYLVHRREPRDGTWVKGQAEPENVFVKGLAVSPRAGYFFSLEFLIIFPYCQYEEEFI